MRAIRISALALLGIVIGVAAARSAPADEFTCGNITSIRTMSDASATAKSPFAKGATLHLSIDRAQPARSTLRWSGDPIMQGVTTTWPDTTHIIVDHGTIAASFYASKDGISSVGTLTLNANGALRIAESALAPKNTVIFDVLEATCQKVP